MKRALYSFLILLLFIETGSGQTTGGQMQPSVYGQASNLPFVTIGAKPGDLKYMYRDNATAKFRPFVSIAEANTYLIATQRHLGMTVIINVGGTLAADGTFTGGVNLEYWWQASTADNALVVKVPTSNYIDDKWVRTGNTLYQASGVKTLNYTGDVFLTNTHINSNGSGSDYKTTLSLSTPTAQGNVFEGSFKVRTDIVDNTLSGNAGYSEINLNSDPDGNGDGVSKPGVLIKSVDPVGAVESSFRLDAANLILKSSAGTFLDLGNSTIGNLASNYSGLKYSANYSANYTPRSLVDKAYVDALVGGAGAGPIGINKQIPFNDNGVMRGSDRILWNNLVKSASLYGRLNLLDTSSESINSYDVITAINTHSGNIEDGLEISKYSVGGGMNGYGAFNLKPKEDGGIYIPTMEISSIYGNTSFQLGYYTPSYYTQSQSFPIDYAGDYSINFTDNSLVTKKWVLQNSGGTNLYNGDGTLTGSTDLTRIVNGNRYKLYLGDGTSNLNNLDEFNAHANSGIDMTDSVGGRIRLRYGRALFQGKRATITSLDSVDIVATNLGTTATKSISKIGGYTETTENGGYSLVKSGVTSYNDYIKHNSGIQWQIGGESKYSPTQNYAKLDILPFLNSASLTAGDSTSKTSSLIKVAKNGLGEVETQIYSNKTGGGNQIVKFTNVGTGFNIGANNNPSATVEVNGSLKATGAVKFDALGTGATKMVIATSDGSLATQDIPTGGGGGTADGNNYPTTLSYASGLLTLGRNGLGDLTASIPALTTSGADGDIQYKSGANLSNTSGFNWTGSSLGVPGSGIFTGGLTSAGLKSTGTYPILDQGTHIQWNRGGEGATYIVNQKGSGTGGVVFGEANTSNMVTQNFVIDASGNLSSRSLVGTGNRMMVANASGVMVTQAIPVADGNNYITGGSYSANTLTLNRSGLPDLSITIPAGGASDGNNYPTALTYASDVLTLKRDGLADLTATIPQYVDTKWKIFGNYLVSPANNVTSISEIVTGNYSSGNTNNYFSMNNSTITSYSKQFSVNGGVLANGFNGITYSIDYSANYNDRSLIDRGYLNTRLSALPALTPAGTDGDIQIKNGTSLSYVNGLNWNNSATTLAIPGYANALDLKVDYARNISQQGTYLQWNKDGTSGMSYLINQRGGGPGGIVFGQSSTANAVTELARITPDGKLGILNNNPQYNLDVAGNARITSLAGTGARMVTADDNGYLYAQAMPSGTVSSVSASVPSAFNVSVSNPSTTPNIAITGAGLPSQFVQGDGTLSNYTALKGAIWNNLPTFLNGQASVADANGNTNLGLTFTGSANQVVLANGTTAPIPASYWTLNNNNLYPKAIENNVGVGTSTPSTKFHVLGGVRLQDGTEGSQKVLTSDADGNATWQIPIKDLDNITGTTGANSQYGFDVPIASGETVMIKLWVTATSASGSYTEELVKSFYRNGSTISSGTLLSTVPATLLGTGFSGASASMEPASGVKVYVAFTTPVAARVKLSYRILRTPAP